jgi:CubicO group peptidase (beta-lactamase class C family)
VTKSVTSTLVGLAVGKGLIASVKAPLLPLFADLSVSNRNARKEAITLEDLLTMRPGLKCEERGQATQSEMRSHPAWAQFILEQHMAGAPRDVRCAAPECICCRRLTRAHEARFDVARREPGAARDRGLGLPPIRRATASAGRSASASA